MKWMMTLMLAGAMGATTKPSTAPVPIDTRPLRDKTLQTQEAIDKAKANAVAKWEASQEYKALKSDMEQNRLILDRARAGTDPQAKLDASKAYNDARLVLEAATAKGIVSRDVADAQTAHRLAVDVLEQAERRNAQMIADADAKDPIKQGIQNHRPVLGMTKDEMGRALAFAGKFNRGSLVRETEEFQLYDFSFYTPRSGERTGYLVWFRDGKAVEIIAP